MSLNTSGLRPWPKGVSGNPGGRKKRDPALVKACREMTPELVKRLRELAMKADSDAASIAACKLLLAYGHGAPDALRYDDDEQASETPTPEQAAEAAAELRRLREQLD